MPAVDPKTLAMLQAQLNATRMSAMETHRTMARGGAGSDGNLLPFLESCARELEETASMIRAAAEVAAFDQPRGC